MTFPARDFDESDHVAFAQALAAGERRAQQLRLLAGVPPRVGPFLLAAAYRSSAAEATIGGDLFDVIPWRDGVRLLIGDVRGKGLGAIRPASLVLGAVRAAAEDLDDLTDVLATVDRRIRRHLADEDLVTACLVQLDPGGGYRIALAGHPAPFVVRTGGRITSLDAPPAHMSGGTLQEAVAATLRRLEVEAVSLNDDLALLAVEHTPGRPAP